LSFQSKNFAEHIYGTLEEIISNTGLEFKDKIQRFRGILEMIFKEITRTETRLFSNLSSRCEFVFESNDTPADLRIEIGGLRKFANKIIHNEEIEHGDITIEEKKAVKTICITLEHFFPVRTPGNLKSFYHTGKELTYRIHQKSLKEKIPFIGASVIKIINPGEDKKYCILKCIDETGDTGEISVSLWNDLQYIGKTAWQFCKINFFNLVHNPEKSMPRNYSSTNDTLAVIEPDYLIDASSIAECFSIKEGTPFLFFLKKFMYSPKTTQILKGLAVNYLLDELITNPTADAEELLDTFFKENLLTLILLSESAQSEIIDDIKATHLANIKKTVELYYKNNILIEPAFYSSRYGISGRLDCLIDYGEGKKDIFELKSGKTPVSDVSYANKFQVTAYNLLLKSAFNGKRRGSSMILYSAAKSSPLRNVTNTIFEEKALLKIRNRIISGEHMLSTGDLRFFDIFTAENFDSLPPFSKSGAYSIRDKYASADKSVKKYFQLFSSFISRELWISKLGASNPGEYTDYGFSSIWRKSLYEKIESSSILHSLIFVNYENDTNTYNFRFDESDIISNFRENDTAIIYPYNDSSVNPLLNQILKCTISSITNSSVSIRMRNKQLGVNYFDSKMKWVIEHDFQETGFTSFTQSVTGLLYSSKADLLLGIKKPESQEYNYHNTGLNESQNAIIKKVFSAKDYFLLQGPPGTGKTSFALMNILKEILLNSESKTAVLTFTNRAANQICDNLKKNNIDFIRFGDDGSNEDYLLKNKIKNLGVSEIKNLIGSARIVVSTVHSFIGRYKDLEPLISFDTIIVDEASQLLEPHLIGLLSGCKKFILIGDHFQLPAISLQNDAETAINDTELNDIGFYDLKVSLFERLFNQCIKNKWFHAIGILENHYRMHDDIAQLINPYYNNRLISVKENQKETEVFLQENLSDSEKEIMKSRLIFIPTGKAMQSQFNTQEAGIIKNLLGIFKKSFGDNFNENTVGVITPWRKQIRCIKDCIIDEEIKSKVVIDTVERYQGSERQIIIISTALFSLNQINNIQSLTFDKKVDRKLNVALSRAISKLIILGCEEILMQDIHYARVLRTIREKGLYLKI